MINALGLDQEQQEVVDYKDSCIVVAGPGSGKTRTLVAKAEKLWDEGRDLICLTFTRAAAQELRDRMPGITALTIHSYCYHEVGWPGNYDKLLFEFIETPIKDRYEWTLVDEVQDLTEEELDVCLSIVGGKLFAVGDPYQSIYGWNGALGMQVFKKLSGFRTFQLRNNYRSDTEIVRLLNCIYDRKLVSTGVVSNGLTAILCRTNAAVREVCLILESDGVGFTRRVGASESGKTREEFFGDDKLKVMTCHCSKGLEFDTVILYKWFPEPLWGEEMNLYYVSVARSSARFYTAALGYELRDIVKEVQRGRLRNFKAKESNS